MKHKVVKVIVSKLLIACLVFSSLSVAFGATITAKSDIKGHWAESQISAWIDKGWINGYPDGSFKPNGTITRAEFVALINRSSGFTEETAITFSDLKSTNWAYKEVAKAVKVGYINGYTDGTFKADKSISRQEVAVIVNKLLGLSATTTVASFSDFNSIGTWAKDAVNAAVDNKILNGYAADNTFKPLNPMSRAEAVVTLDRANEPKAVVYDKPGTYGPLTGTEIVDKNVVINTPGVTLQNMTLNGKLLFASGINSGDATLKNVTVKGETSVQGGGVNSIHFENSFLTTVTVNKAATSGSVRIVAEGTTAVEQVIVKSPVTLQEVNATGSGFKNVTLSEELPAGSEVILKGTFDKVVVLAVGIHVILAEGSIKEFTASAIAKGLILDLAAGTTITTLNLDTVTTVTGKGTITSAILSPAVQATGSQKFETAPGTVTVGTTPTPTPSPTTTPAPGNTGGNGSGGSGGSGNGDGGGGTPATVPSAPTNLTAVAGNTTVGLSWTAPAGSTSYKVYRSTTSGSGYVSLQNGVTATTYSVTGLSNGTPYYFVVKATNSVGDSVYSTEVSATPQTVATGSITFGTPNSATAAVYGTGTITYGAPSDVSTAVYSSGTFNYGTPGTGSSFRVGATTFTYGTDFNTLSQLTTAIDELPNVSAVYNGAVITVSAVVYGKSEDSIALAIGSPGPGTSVSDPTLTGGSTGAATTFTVDGQTFTMGTDFTTITGLTSKIDALPNVSATHNGTVITIKAETSGANGNSITLAVNNPKTSDTPSVSGTTLSGGANAVPASTFTVDGTIFTKISSAASGNNFNTIADLTALINALASVNASYNNGLIMISAAAPGTAGNNITLSGENFGSGSSVSGPKLTGGA